MSSPDAGLYLAWNERVARFWLRRPTAGSEAYLTITPRGLALALWECDGVQLPIEEAEEQLIAAVRAGYQRWVVHVHGDVGGLARMAPTGDVPLCLAFLAASVLAAHRMRADDANRANAYYARLAQILAVDRARDLPQGFSKDGFEALWIFARQWTLKRGLPPLFLPETGEIVQKYVAYPLAHTELREVDLKKLPAFFDWAGYAPSASVALERLREDFAQWYPRSLTAQGRAACEDHRLGGVLQQIAQELTAWNGVAEDETGRRVAHVELTLDIVRGSPKLSYLARRPPGFPDVFEYEWHRFDSLEEGWYDPVPVPQKDGRHLLDGFEWSDTADASAPAFVLKRRPTRAIAFVRSEEYSGLTSRRRLLAGVECALLYHESVSEIVDARMKQVAEGPLRPITDPGLPSGWRVLLDVHARPNADAVPDLEALEVDAAVELMTVGGLRLGRHASWLVDCPPRLLVSGMQRDVRVNGQVADVGPSGVVEWERLGREPGVHVVEAGRAHLRIEIVEGSLADGLHAVSERPLGATHSVALARGRWEVIGKRPGEIVDVDLANQAILRVPFEPIWAIRCATPGVALYLASCDHEPGQPVDDASAVERWASAITAASGKDTPLACVDPAAARGAQKQWRSLVRVARRCSTAVGGVG